MNVDSEIVTTRSGKIFCQSQGLAATFRVLPIEGMKLGVIASYVIRCLEGSLYLLASRGKIYSYSATDILPDVLPAAMLKLLLGRKSRTVSWVFHLIPSSSERAGSRIVNTISFLSQRVSLLLMRRYSDAIIVDNSTVKKELISIGLNPTKIAVVPLGVNKNVIDSAKPAPFLSYDACFLGRLHRTKGVFDLVQIWKLVVEKRRSAKLAIIGGDPTGKVIRELEKIIAALGMKDNIDFLGWLQIEAFSIMKSSRLFLFPSHEEGWAIAVCEAMAAGLVPIVYDLPAYREFFNEGLVSVSKGDVHAFAKEVNELLLDEDRRLALRTRAIACASKYSWEATATAELKIVLGPSYQDP